MTRSAGRPSVLRAPGAWAPVVVFAAAGVVFALHGTDGALRRDFGAFLYGGEQLTRGVPSYVGIFNSVGPLSDAVPGLAILVGRSLGLDPVLAPRLLYLALSAGCCAALYVLARRVFDSSAAGFLAAALLAGAGNFTRLSSDGPREKTLMLLCLLLALIWLLDRRWFLAGAATAVATLTWQPVFAVAVAGFIGAVALLTNRRARALGQFLLGGAIPSLAAVVAFAATGALGMAIDGFIVINAVYTRQPSLLSDPIGTVGMLWKDYSWSLLPIVLGLVLLPMLLLDAWRRRAEHDGWRSLGVMVVAEIGAVGWLLVAINGGPDLFDVLPFGALGAAGAVVRLAGPLPRRVFVALLAACTLAAVAVATSNAVLSKNDGLVGQRLAVDNVMDVLPRADGFLSVNAPNAMFLAGRTNPTPWQIFNGSEDRFMNAHYPGGLAGYARWVAHVRPGVVVVGGRNPERWLHGVLRADYTDLGRFGKWEWYASTTLSRPTQSRLGAAVALGREQLRSTDHGGLNGPRVFSAARPS